MTCRRSFLTILLFAGTALLAAAQPVADELEQNRRGLEAIRKDPEQLGRLRENLQSFLNLPEKKREKIRQLEHDLRLLPADKQVGYYAALERYADWLDHLRQED